MTNFAAMIQDEIPTQSIFSEQEQIFERYALDESVRDICFAFKLKDGCLLWYKVSHISSSRRIYGIGLLVNKPYKIEIKSFTSGLKFSEIENYVCIPLSEWNIWYDKINNGISEIGSFVSKLPIFREKKETVRFFYSLEQNIMATIQPNGIVTDIREGISNARSFEAYYWGIDEDCVISPPKTYGNWSYYPPTVKDHKVVVSPGIMYTSAKWKEISEAIAIELHNRMVKLRRSFYVHVYNTINGSISG